MEACPEMFADTRECRGYYRSCKNFYLGHIFFLHDVVKLVFCDGELALCWGSESRSRRTRVKIEYVIAARPTSLSRNPNSEKKSRQTDALAACGGDVFHGVGRH